MTHRKIYKTLVALVCSATLLSSCDGWIEDASTPSDTLSPEQITRVGMLGRLESNGTIVDGALTANLRTLTGEVAGATYLAHGAIVDELSVGVAPNTFLYRDLNADVLTPRTGSQDGLWDRQHNLRGRSAELLGVVDRLTSQGVSTSQVPILLYARYHGLVASALAHRYLAESFSTTPGQDGGSVRLLGRLWGQAELLDLSERQLREAIALCDRTELSAITSGFSANLAKRQAQGVLLSLLVSRGRYADASQLAGFALTDAEALTIRYSADGRDNPLYSQLGNNARDVQVSPSLEQARGNQAERLALPLGKMTPDRTKPSQTNTYITSLSRHSPLTLFDRGELALIRAELMVRGLLSGSALDEVNTVVAPWDASSVDTSVPTLERIAHLRRIYLAVRGARLADARRGMLPSAEQAVYNARSIKYMPMPERELEGI